MLRARTTCSMPGMHGTILPCTIRAYGFWSADRHKIALQICHCNSLAGFNTCTTQNCPTPPLNFDPTNVAHQSGIGYLPSCLCHILLWTSIGLMLSIIVPARTSRNWHHWRTVQSWGPHSKNQSLDWWRTKGQYPKKKGRWSRWARTTRNQRISRDFGYVS